MDWEAFEKKARNNGLLELKVIDVPLNKQPTAESIRKMHDRLKPQIAQNEANQTLAMLQKTNHSLV